MRNVLAIASKELRVYLTTWISWVLCGLFMLITATLFQSLVVQYQNQSLEFTQQGASHMLERMNLTEWVVAPVFYNITVVFMFVLPILTMRTYAEERRHKSFELMMTLPVRPLELVLGKYLGTLAVVAGMLGLTLLFPVLLTFVADAGGQSPIDWNTIAVSYLGMFLMSAAFVAVGQFASSLTDSQVVAAVIGFAVLLLVLLVGTLAEGQEGAVQAILRYIALATHLETFISGVIKISDVVYYLSVGFVGLFLTHRVVEAQRWR
jgi:ABC-2 type transport system permease protein